MSKIYPATSWQRLTPNQTDPEKGLWVDALSEDGLYHIPVAHVIKGSGWKERCALFCISNKIFERLQEIEPDNQLFQDFESIVNSLG